MAVGAGRWASYAVLASAAFYHPLTLLAANAWEISPAKTLVVGLAIGAIELALFIPLGRLTRQPLATAAIIAISPRLDELTNNRESLVDSRTARRLHSPHNERWRTLPEDQIFVLIAFFGLGSLANLLIEHFARAQPYPVALRSEALSAQPTGRVEDVLLFVVDQYPALSLAEAWFGHDAASLESSLSGFGFTTLHIAWSTNTSTALSIPSMLELRQVGASGEIEYGNRSPLIEIMGGDNFTAQALRAAAFTYHHVEGGWEASACGSVDVCHEGPLLDGTMFKLFEYSILGS